MAERGMESHFNPPSKVSDFLRVLGSTSWGITASRKTIDDLFQCAVHLQGNPMPELGKKYPGIDFNKSLDLLLENILKNHHLDERVTLHAINRYDDLSPGNFPKILENLTCELELREQVSALIVENPNVDLDFVKMNRFLHDVDGSNFETKMANAVKFESSVLLDSLEHCSDLTGPVLVDGLITCLASHPDLRLWFILFKNENAKAVARLCGKYDHFLDAVLLFFDKFADEIESTYDEDLNVKYSHVNLDFEDFVKIFQTFLNEKSVRPTVEEYLDGKTLLDKNYCFWIDLKSCIEC